MIGERSLRTSTRNPESNPFSSSEAIKKHKDKFVNIWSGKKLTAVGCNERHTEPRYLAEHSERENAILSNSLKNYGDYSETQALNSILEKQRNGEVLTLDQMVDIFNNEER